MISFQRVGVRYGSAQALAEVSEQVPAGQWLGIIGRNGTGKSTLLRAAARLVGHEGTITIGGQPTGGMSRPSASLRHFLRTGRSAPGCWTGWIWAR